MIKFEYIIPIIILYYFSVNIPININSLLISIIIVILIDIFFINKIFIKEDLDLTQSVPTKPVPTSQSVSSDQSVPTKPSVSSNQSVPTKPSISSDQSISNNQSTPNNIPVSNNQSTPNNTSVSNNQSTPNNTSVFNNQPVSNNSNVNTVVDLSKKYDENMKNLTEDNLGYPTVDKIVNNTTSQANSPLNCDCETVAKKAIYNFLKERRLIDKKGLIHYADDYFGDMGYSDIRWENYISPKEGGQGVYNSFDMSQYQLINTDRWAPPSRFAPQCKTDIQNTVQPMTGYPVNLQDFDSSLRILPKDKINLDYIKDRLN